MANPPSWRTFSAGYLRRNAGRTFDENRALLRDARRAYGDLVAGRRRRRSNPATGEGAPERRRAAFVRLGLVVLAIVAARSLAARG